MATRHALPNAPFARFFSHEELAGYLHRLVAARPGLCRLDSLGESRQGRAIHLLTVTDFATGEAQDKPAYPIHANIHASEVAGTQARSTADRFISTEPSRILSLSHQPAAGARMRTRATVRPTRTLEPWRCHARMR